MRRLIALTFFTSLVIGTASAQTPEPRTLLLAVDDLHLEFPSTPRARKILEDLVKIARDGDRWALVTTGTSNVHVTPGPASAVLEGVNRIVGNQVTKPESLRALADPDRATIIRQHAHDADTTISLAISDAARSAGGPVIVFYLTDGYDTRIAPGMSKVAHATAETRSHLFVIAPRDIVPPAYLPTGVKPDVVLAGAQP